MNRGGSARFVAMLAAVIVLAVVGGFWYYRPGRSSNMVASRSTGQSPRPAISSSTNNSSTLTIFNDGIGVTSGLVYQDNNVGLMFRYPQGWHVVDDGLGINGGTLDLFNYDETQVSGSVFPPGKNKIEMSVVDTPAIATSSDYPEQSRTVVSVMVAGQSAIKTDSILVGGTGVNGYTIPIPLRPGNYLDIIIFGDPKNFSILDSVVQGVSWTK